MNMTVDDKVFAQDLSHDVCGVITKCGSVRAMCELSACTPRVR